MCFTCDYFNQDFGGQAALRGWVAIFDFVGSAMFGGSFSVGLGVLIYDVLHGAATAKEDAFKSVWVKGCCSILGFLGCYLGSKC
jgi:hypothetical protein